MTSIKKKWSLKFGYLPSDSEVLNAYTNGELCLSDSEENQLLKYFNL
jgi:hypothetical protein